MIQEPPLKQSVFTDDKAKVMHQSWHQWLFSLFRDWGKFGDIKGGNYTEISKTGAVRYYGTAIPPTHADNAAALAAGLVAGQTYKTSVGVLMIVV